MCSWLKWLSSNRYSPQLQIQLHLQLSAGPTGLVPKAWSSALASLPAAGPTSGPNLDPKLSPSPNR